MTALFCVAFIVTQLLIIFAFLYGIPGTSYLGDYQQNRADSFLRLGTVADMKKAEVDQWIRNIRNDTRKFCASGITRREVARLLSIGQGGQAAATLRGNRAILSEVSGLFGSEHTTYRSIRIADARNGLIIFSSIPSEIGRSLDQDVGFLRVRQGNMPYHIDIRKDPLTEKANLSFCREILAPGQALGTTPIAVLLAEIDPEEMAAFILHTGVGLGESGEVVLVNQDQFVLTTLRKPLKDGSIALPLETRLEALPAVNAAAGAEGIIAGNDYAGVPVFAAYRHIRLSSDFGWGMVVKQSQREALASLREKMSLYAILSTVAVLLVLAVSLLLARMVSRPILRLSEVAAAVEEGNLSARAPEGGGDELGALGRTFNNMVHRVQEWHEELNLEVETRTSELSVANETLRKEIAERQKAEEELDRANAELEEKNRDLEQVVYVASHDLRSPLVNIIGFSREVRRSLSDIRAAIADISLTEQERKAIDAILRDDIDPALGFIAAGTEKMDRLLAGLLRLSRTERARLEIAPTDMDLLLEKVLRTFEFQIKKYGVTVLREPLPPCRGDEVQLNQVFSNLVDNAVKYLDPTRPGTVRITGKVEDGHVIYCVEDNGIGIPAAHQGKIFEIFHRLRPADSAGEGLGLSIVRKILYRHGGRLWVESEEGKGSKFLVSLPKKMG